MAAHASTVTIGAENLFEASRISCLFACTTSFSCPACTTSFILREDGRLNELLLKESLDLHIQNVPGISHVSSGSAALELARSQPRFNLIVTNLQVGDMNAAELATQVKQAGLDIPVMVLAYDYREVNDFIARRPHTDIERIFLWQGNGRILISMVKYIEDKRNVQHDAEIMGVPIVLLVEDDIVITHLSCRCCIRRSGPRRAASLKRGSIFSTSCCVCARVPRYCCAPPTKTPRSRLCSIATTCWA